MKKIILIDNYDSFTFNLYHYISSLKVYVDVIRNDQITSNEILKRKYNKIVISPGPGNPNQSGNCIKIVKSLYKKIPIFGVCLGHQIIGQVFGSKIIQAKKLMHGKTSKILSKKTGLLKNLPKTFEATRYHSLIIDKKSLSKDLEITAETKDGLIMGVRHKKYPVHGVQFHPESIKTKIGIKILKNFIKNLRLMKQFIEKIKNKENLSFDESKAAFEILMEGKAEEQEIFDFLTQLSTKGESSDEIAGGVFVLRNKSKRVNVENCVDTCGTGGDGMNTLNISTASALLLASMGVKVAKHGNKAVSSKCGSGDVLEALNIKIDLEPNDIETQINKNNFGFMFAPNYHSAMRFVGPTRKKIGKRTIFNMIGPLSSPALVKRQVVGVFDKKLLKIFANALNNLDIKFAWIVNSEDGLDEISPYAKTNVIQLKDNKISEIIIDPKELNINADKFDNLVGDDAKFNADKMINIFKGEDNDFSKAVCLNAAAGLIVNETHQNFTDAYNNAREHILSNKVIKHLEKIQNG